MADGDVDMIESRPEGAILPDLSGVMQPAAQSSVESKSPLHARSLLTQTLNTEFLPPERFRGEQEGEVVDIKKIGETVAIVRRLEGHYAASIYDGMGNVVQVLLDPSNKDISQSNVGHEYIKTKPGNTSAADTDPSVLFQRLGFSKKDAEGLKGLFYSKMQNSTNDYTNNSGLTQHTSFYIQVGHWEIGVTRSNDPAGRAEEQFVFQAENGGFIVDPNNPSAKIPIEKDKIDTHEYPLNNDLSLRRGNTVFSVQTSEGREIASYTGINPVVDPSNPDRLLFINGGRIYGIDIPGIANKTSTPQLESQINITDARELQIDPNGNFYVIRSEKNQLLVIDRDAGEVAQTFDNVRGPIIVDKQGDILLVDNQGKLREVQTNFQAIPAGGDEKAKLKREENLKALQDRFASLELKKVERQRGAEISEEDVANTLRQTIARQVDEPLTQATDPDAIEDIMDRLQGLKGDPANQGYGEVVDEFITKAREKLSGIRTTELTSQLEVYGKSLDGVQSVGDTIGLDEQFARLLELRQKTDITDPNIRRSIEQQLRTIQTRKETIVGQYQGELLTAINSSIPAIEQLIKETGSTQELAMFGTSVEAQQFEMMLANVRDPQVRRELRDRLNAIRAEQRTGLEARGRQLEDEQRLRWAQVVEEAKEDLDSLRQQITQLEDTKELDRFERNPLVTAWRAKIFALPPELREIEEKKLEVIMGSRKKDMQHRRELGAVGEIGELKFGNTSFPVYKEPPRIWQPKLIPIKGAMPGYADLVFEDEQGKTWQPDSEHRTVVIADMNHEQTARMVERYRKEAEDYFKGLRRDVPDYDEHWKITEGKMSELAQVTESFNLQLDNHMGLTILEGEAGTGKNVDIDMIANLSNREVVTIACNERTEKEDLTYEFYYDPARGTYKLPSRLIDALKRPGVIILFDEINTVKPGIVKMLNPLFDYRRKLVVNEGGVEQEITADPTAILAGTMNPQDYAGVDRLAETILSRADILEVDYPPFDVPARGRTLYRSDEAEMLYSYMHGLNGLQQREFKLCWDNIINRDTSNGADRYMQGNPQIEADTRRLYDAIRVADRLRGMYKAYQVGQSNEPMDFTTSIREMVNIALRMNHNADVKQVVKRVILPKIGDRRQRVMVDQTINAVLPT